MLLGADHHLRLPRRAADPGGPRDAAGELAHDGGLGLLLPHGGLLVPGQRLKDIPSVYHRHIDIYIYNI